MNRLGEILAEKGLTYQALSTLIKRSRGTGVSESTLTRVVKYNDTPSITTREAIAEALNMRVEEIWSEDNAEQ